MSISNPRIVSPTGEITDRIDTPMNKPSKSRDKMTSEGNKTAPSRKRTTSPQQKKCRICFQTDVLGNGRSLARGKEPVSRSWFFPWWRKELQRPDPLEDGFISPCACKGSMAWVHKRCLGEWRRKSARRDSFYSCEYCFVSYRFKHTWIASFLNNTFTLTFLTMIMVVFTLIVAAFMVAAAIPMRSIFAEDISSGIFSNDGVFVPISPYKHRWAIKTSEPVKTIYVQVDPTDTPKEITEEEPSKDHDHAHPTETTDIIISSKAEATTEADDISSAHSIISYFNIAYWLTGHSMDEQEEEMNDFLLAMMDMGTLKVWAGAIGILGILALFRDGTQWSLIVAVPLALSTFFMHFATMRLFSWLYPIPALYGVYRFVCWEYELVELSVDTFIKNVSSELENYQ